MKNVVANQKHDFSPLSGGGFRPFFLRSAGFFFVSRFYGSTYVFFRSLYLVATLRRRSWTKGNQTLFRSRSDCTRFRYMLRKPDALTLKLVFHSKVYNGKKIDSKLLKFSFDACTDPAFSFSSIFAKRYTEKYELVSLRLRITYNNYKK